MSIMGTMVGVVGQEPELRSTQDGTPVLGIRLGVSLGADTETVWFDVSYFGRYAPTLKEKLSHRDRVMVFGEAKMIEIYERRKQGKGDGHLSWVGLRAQFQAKKIIKMRGDTQRDDDGRRRETSRRDDGPQWGGNW